MLVSRAGEETDRTLYFFCVVGDLVAEDAKRRTGSGGGRAEGHITITGSRAFQQSSSLRPPSLRRDRTEVATGRTQAATAAIFALMVIFRIAVGRF